MYFVDDIDAYTLADLYAKFRSSLTWYRMYCYGHYGTDKSDYKDGFDSLKEAVEELFEYSKVPEHLKISATTLLGNIEGRLKRRRFTTDDINYISKAVWEFEKNIDEFTHAYLDSYLRNSAEEDLPYGMRSIIRSLEHEEYNTAIVDSFKYLDWLLQTIFNVSPHDYYGESLINFAFSPNEGKVKLDTHENEQRGLRNYVSGLYALFRNPAAHRDAFDKNSGIIRFGGFSGAYQAASTIVHSVSLVAVLIYENIYRSLDEQIRSELIKVAEKYNWNQEIVQESWKYQYHWAIGLLPESKHKSRKSCQLLVTLNEDYQGPHLKVSSKAELNRHDLEEFMDNISQMSHLRTVLRQE